MSTGPSAFDLEKAVKEAQADNMVFTAGDVDTWLTALELTCGEVDRAKVAEHWTGDVGIVAVVKAQGAQHAGNYHVRKVTSGGKPAAGLVLVVAETTYIQLHGKSPDRWADFL